MRGEERPEKVYSFGYSDAAVGLMESRSAERNAAFFIAKLEPSMNVLDIGCGPGSITVGLAAFVPRGEVVGVDIEASQVKLASERARNMGLGNCRFETGSVYDLPLADASVDAVFGHTILMLFKELEPVLREVNRVLRPGGFAGFREIDFGASLYHSPDSAMRTVMSTLSRAIQHNDGNPDIGRSLPSILSAVGLQILTTAASYASAATPEAKRRTYSALRHLWEQADFVDQAESLGWLSPKERAALPKKLDDEAKDPGSLSGSTFVEVLARKPI